MRRIVEKKKKKKLERLNVCVNDVPEEEVGSNPILLIHKLQSQSFLARRLRIWKEDADF